MAVTVGYQGHHGTFSEMAVLQFFEGKNYIPKGYKNFPTILKDVAQKKLDYALIPVENTTTGIIARTYDLLSMYEVFAVGEINLPIRHNLIVQPGTTLEDIQEIYSHPEALDQCQKFFMSHPNMKAIAYQDTAKSVEYIAQQNQKEKAAIGSVRAAEYYGMEILEKNIQDTDTNITRFLCICPNVKVKEDANKTSLKLVLKHEPGSLYKALSVLADNEINLLKLESRPLPNQPFQYCFYLDFTGNILDSRIQKILSMMKEQTEELHVLGCYKAFE